MCPISQFIGFGSIKSYTKLLQNIGGDATHNVHEHITVTDKAYEWENSLLQYVK